MLPWEFLPASVYPEPVQARQPELNSSTSNKFSQDTISLLRFQMVALSEGPELWWEDWYWPSLVSSAGIHMLVHTMSSSVFFFFCSLFSNQSFSWGVCGREREGGRGRGGRERSCSFPAPVIISCEFPFPSRAVISLSPDRSDKYLRCITVSHFGP